jgi:LCP family protein required for cell wall assembly
MGPTPSKPPAPRRPRPLLAAGLSATVPGAGQAYAGRVRRGLILLGVDAVLIALGVVFTLDRLGVVKAAFKPRFLTALMVGNIVLLGFRIWAADDAYRCAHHGRMARTPARTGRVGAVATGVLALMLVVPHAAVAYYDLVQYNLITTVFAEDDTTTTTTQPSAVDTGIGATTTTTQPAAPALWDGLDRLNILLLGGDAGVGRTGIRTDTMIVVSIDPASGDVAMFGIPRNWTRVPLPDGMGVWDCNCFPRLLNDLYIAGSEYPDAFPGPGTPGENAIKAGIGELLGIPIHYYALVTLDGFVGIVDALGGVDIDVPFRIVDETYPHEDGVTTEYVDILPGPQHLDGHLALAYVRARRHADDYARMGRQRCVLDAVLEQSDPAELLLAYPRIAGVLEETLQTDIPLSRIPDLIDLLPVVDLDSIVSVRFIPPTYLAEVTDEGRQIPNVDLIHHDVQLVLDSTPEEATAALGIEPLGDACTPDDQ